MGTMELPKELTTVTTNSKVIAMLIFIALPFIGFFAGTTYQSSVTPKSTENNIVSTPKTNTSSSTASWNAYSNSKYEFEFKYPPTLKVLGDASNSVSFTYSLPTEQFPDGYPVLTVSEGKTIDYKSLPSCSQEPNSICLDDGKKWGQEKDVVGTIVGGVTAQSFYLGTIGEERHVVQTTKSPLVEVSMFVVKAESLDKEFKQILSTFKFTDQSQTDSTADWNTYTSQNELFSVKYPPDWAISTASASSRKRGTYLGGFHNKALWNIDYFSVSFELDTKQENQTLADYATSIGCLRMSDIYVDPKCKISSQKTISVDDKFSIYQSFRTLSGPTVEVYIPMDTTKVVVLTTYNPIGDGEIDSSVINTINQILSTFKFTK